MISKMKMHGLKRGGMNMGDSSVLITIMEIRIRAEASMAGKASGRRWSLICDLKDD